MKCSLITPFQLCFRVCY